MERPTGTGTVSRVVDGSESTVPEGAGGAGAATPSKVGRFVIEGVLGQGGMGMVFVAHDPVLDRRVALKLVRVAAHHASADAYQARLLREAQALARLTHPGVVTVYEAGLVDGAVFIAMELVEGGTLKDWMTQPHPWREVVEVFLAAGRGLAAAHAAGLVHRDFKPANVFIDAGRRVKVGDFGLVGLADGDAPPSISPATDSPLLTTLTETGAPMGTPAYMAPEQVRGDKADARADQYSFCVSLHEALTGQRPRAEGERRPMPPRLRPIVDRGLAEDPSDRHPSMAALLVGLERTLRGRRTMALVGGGAGLVAAAAATTFLLAGRGPDPREAAETACVAGPERLHGAWSPARRGAVEQAFTATRLPYAATSGTRVGELLDRYAADWLGARTEACRATHVLRDQSEVMLDLRVQCLDRRREQLDELATALASPLTQSEVDQAIGIASKLPRIDDCANASQLQAVIPLPADPVERQRAEQALAEVAGIQTLYKLGRYPAAQARLDTLIERTRGLNYAPVQSDAEFLRGWFAYRASKLKDAETAFNASLQHAVAAGDVRREERGWRTLLTVVGMAPDRAAETELLRRADWMALERAGWPPIETAEHHNFVVRNRINQGSLAEAERVAREVLGKIPPGDHWNRGVALDQLARTLALLKRPEETIEIATQAVKHWETELGPQHPKVAFALASLAKAYNHSGKLAEAEATLRRTLAVLVAAHGPDNIHLYDTYEELAGLAVARDQKDAVRDYTRRMIAVMQPVEKDDVSNWSNALNQAGMLLNEVGLTQEGIALLRRGVAAATAGGETKDAAIGSFYLAVALNGTGSYQEALALCTSVFETLSARFGSAWEASGHHCRGEALLGLRRLPEAMRALERALAAAEQSKDPADLGTVTFTMARALWQRGDRARALTMADQAMGHYQGPQFARQRAAIERWRRDKPASR